MHNFLIFVLLKQCVEAGRHRTQLRISAPVVEFNSSHENVKLESAVTKVVDRCADYNGTSTQGAKPVPKIAKFQICNAYSPHLTMKVEIGRGRMKSNSPTPYGSCVVLVGKTWRHDVVVVHLEGQIPNAPHVDGDGPGKLHDGYGQQRRSVEMYLQRDACANNSGILVAVTNHGKSAGGLEMWVAFFEYLVRPQVALVDAAPYDGGQQSVAINPEKSEYITSPVDLTYGDIKAIAPGIFDVELEGKTMEPQLTAECDECYSIIRLAKGKVMVYPPASGQDRFNCHPKGEAAPPPPRSTAPALSGLVVFLVTPLIALLQ